MGSIPNIAVGAATCHRIADVTVPLFTPPYTADGNLTGFSNCSWQTTYEVSGKSLPPNDVVMLYSKNDLLTPVKKGITELNPALSGLTGTDGPIGAKSVMGNILSIFRPNPGFASGSTCWLARYPIVPGLNIGKPHSPQTLKPGSLGGMNAILANTQLLSCRQYGTTSVIGGIGDTWNPSDKSAAITLGSGNLDATQNGAASAWRSVRSTANNVYKTSGKIYFEAIADVIDSSNGWILGIANASASLASFIGSDVDGIGWQSNQSVYNNGSVISIIGGILQGNVVGVAIDFANKLIWFRNITQNAPWNNNASANPTTGSGGIAVPSSVINGGTIFVGWSGFNASASDKVMLNVGQQIFVGVVPVGFTSWSGATQSFQPSKLTYPLFGIQCYGAGGTSSYRLIYTSHSFPLALVSSTGDDWDFLDLFNVVGSPNGSTNTQWAPTCGVPDLSKGDTYFTVFPGGSGTKMYMGKMNLDNIAQGVNYQPFANLMTFDDANINSLITASSIQNLVSTPFGFLGTIPGPPIFAGQAANIIMISRDGTQFVMIRLAPQDANSSADVAAVSSPPVMLDISGTFYMRGANNLNPNVYNSFSIDIPWTPVDVPTLNTPSLSIPGLCGCQPPHF